MNMAELRAQPPHEAGPQISARANPPRSGGFPLASLALLVTMFAIALACADLDRWNEQYEYLTRGGPTLLVILFGAAGIFGALIGLVHPLLHGFTVRSLLIAPASGFLAGWIGAFLLAASGPIWRTIFAIGVLLLSAAILRLNSD